MAEAQQALQLIEELRAQVKRQSTTRVVIALVVICVIGGYSYRTYSTVTGFDQQRFTDALVESATAVVPGVSRNITMTVTRLLPVYTEEAVKQSEERLPDLYGKLNVGLGKLMTRAEDRFSKRADHLQSRVEKSIDASLVKHYPQLAKDDKMREQIKARILLAFETSAREAVRDSFKAPIKEVRRLIAASSKLGKEAKVDAPKGEKAEARMVVSLLTVLSRKLAQEGATLSKSLKKSGDLK